MNNRTAPAFVKTNSFKGKEFWVEFAYHGFGWIIKDQLSALNPNYLIIKYLKIRKSARMTKICLKLKLFDFLANFDKIKSFLIALEL